MIRVSKLSVVIPVYQANGNLDRLLLALQKVLKTLKLKYEIILVEDGSKDGSWEEIALACSKNTELIGLKLSRNFGQHYAISAGLMESDGDWVVVMDCDLQDQPSEIPNLLRKAGEGFDVVTARRAKRSDVWTKKLYSFLFYSLLGWLTGVRQDPAVANFGIYSRKVIQAINGMPETIRYFPTMVRWVGFQATTLDVVHGPKLRGRSSYTLKKLLNLALDICLANSDKPLRLVVVTGFLVASAGFVFAAHTIYRAFQGEIVVLGYASLLVSIWILSGLIILITGVVGLYVGKSFEGIKQHPVS